MTRSSSPESVRSARTAADRESYFAATAEGRSGIRTITQFDPELAPLPHRRRGRLRPDAVGRREEHPPRLARRADGHRRRPTRRCATRSSIRCAMDLETRQLDRRDARLGRRRGRVQRADVRALVQGRARSRPRSTPIPSGTIGTIASEISMAYDLHGFSHLISTGCTSSTDAIGYAYRNLKLGVCDYVLTGGADATITEGGDDRLLHHAHRHELVERRSPRAARARSRATATASSSAKARGCS